MSPRDRPLPSARDPLTLAPDGASVARFHADLSRVGVVDGGAPLLVAVSGGPDSVALLLLAQAVLGTRCHAATVDHGLRAESAVEAAFVARLCDAIRVPHITLGGSLPPRTGRTANISARARAYRYRLLDGYADAIGAGHIATAHHADDQLETLVMRLNRGAGVGGLAGIRARTGRIVRPLLGWRRADLAAIVTACGVVPADDPSNRDERFDRARLRKAIAGADWLDPAGAAQTARNLADAEAALVWATDTAAATRLVSKEGMAALDHGGLPEELRRRLFERCIRHVDEHAACRGPSVTRAIAVLDRGRRAMLGEVLCVPDGSVWRFVRAPRRSR